MRKFLAITDRTIMGSDPLLAMEQLIDAHGPQLILQIREKNLPAAELYRWIKYLLPRAAARDATLMINDRADLALTFAPHVGLHLPSRGLPVATARALLGPTVPIARSIHAPGEAAEGADFVLLAPIFTVPGKGPPLGLPALREACASSKVPVFALGGIDATKAPDVFAAGAAGIAAIRAAWTQRPLPPAFFS